jgi:hypothetical protein
VILLLPSPDLEESTKIVNDRFVKTAEAEGEAISDEVMAVNAHFVKHPSNQKLAKMIVYTKDKSPEETCAEIVSTIMKGG